ncbi:MAG: hypothetical protein C5B50_11470 [Verrucomicrobia bacterium]|nr:MAG: hypothetical protein C5B50_11470 [Verrucomicrobiota bacterium]
MVLLVQPAQKFLKTRISEYRLHCVESVPQFIMAPGLVNETFTRLASGNNLRAAFATRNNMVPPRQHVPFAEHTN